MPTGYSVSCDSGDVLLNGGYSISPLAPVEAGGWENLPAFAQVMSAMPVYTPTEDRWSFEVVSRTLSVPLLADGEGKLRRLSDQLFRWLGRDRRRGTAAPAAECADLPTSSGTWKAQPVSKARLRARHTISSES